MREKRIDLTGPKTPEEVKPILDQENPIAEAPRARADDNSLALNIRELMKEATPSDSALGYSEERVKQLKLLANYHKKLTREELETFIFPYIYDLFLKGFRDDEMALAFGVTPKVINGWLESIRKINAHKLEGYDAFAALNNTFNQYDMIMKLAMEDYITNKGGSQGATYLKLALQTVNDKMKWSFDLRLLDPVKNKAHNIDDPGAKQKAALDSSIDLLISRVHEIKNTEIPQIES